MEDEFILLMGIMALLLVSAARTVYAIFFTADPDERADS